MPDNGNKTRPVRTLTVRNFSVIKEAKLEFGKITVLIGPQASGKSLLCKLAYFLSKEVLEIAVGRAMNDFDFSTFEDDVMKKFREWFPIGGWGTKDWSISLVSDNYEITASGVLGGSQNPTTFRLEFGETFRHEYTKQLSNPRSRSEEIIYNAFSRLMGKSFWDGATYIPSERSYFVDTQKGYRLLVSQPDPIASRFAGFYASSLDPDIPKEQLNAHLQGELTRGGDSWLFSFADGRVLPLNLLSTGSKELLPLLCALEMYAHQCLEIMLDDELVSSSDEPSLSPEEETRFLNEEIVFPPERQAGLDEFFVEEPEAHIFPKKQYELVQYFAKIVNDENLRTAITITTHSPYILSAFNNLIEASQVAAAKPDLKQDIAKLIPEQYWVKSEDFKAYCIHDGNLESIMDTETGLISANYLDSVSETIGVEFDELLRLGYVES